MAQETIPKTRVPDLDLGTALHLGYALLWYFDEVGLKAKTVTTAVGIKGQLHLIKASVDSHEITISPVDR
jgi:hypothetical protein